MSEEQVSVQEGKVGIQETKEALVAVNEVGLHLVRRLKDGVQLTDFVAFYNDFINDAEFKAKLEAAWANHQAIPEEIKDIDLGEGIELASLQIGYVPKFVAELLG